MKNRMKALLAAIALALGIGTAVVIVPPKDEKPIKEVPVKRTSVIFEGVAYPVLNVKDSGAIGDGIADDYGAWLKCAKAINVAGGGEIYFPSGTYYYDEYAVLPNYKIKGLFAFKTPNEMRALGYDINFSKKGDTTGTFNWNVSLPNNASMVSPVATTAYGDPTITLTDLNYLKISGDGMYTSTVSVKGDFFRYVDALRSFAYSNHYAISAISINNSKNVTIENIELRGNVQETGRGSYPQDSKPYNVVESGGRNLEFYRCNGVTVTNVSIHHAQMDGITFRIRSDEIYNENFLLTNVKIKNCARQGVTVGSLINSKFVNCSFDSTGYTGGNYGSHDPAAGVDIEPEYVRIPKAYNIEFYNCDFIHNKKTAVTVTHANDTKDIYFNKCTFVNSDYGVNFVMASSPNVVFDSCYFDAGKGAIYPSRDMSYSNIQTTIKNSYIKGKEGKGGIVITRYDEKAATRTFIFENNTIEYYGTTDQTFPRISSAGSFVKYNTLILPTGLTINSKMEGAVSCENKTVYK